MFGAFFIVLFNTVVDVPTRTSTHASDWEAAA